MAEKSKHISHIIINIKQMKKIFGTLIITGLLTLGCGNEQTKKDTQDNTPTIPVKIATVTTTSQTNFLSASGKVTPIKSATLSTRNMGYVEKIYTEVGHKVHKGQLLISINSKDLIAQKAQTDAGIAEATAAFENAKKDYKRFKNLFNSKSATQKELDDITAHYNMAKARLEAAKQAKNTVDAQFSYSNIKAPFSGIVTQKFVKSGDMANPGMPLLQIENPNDFEVVAMIPESEVAKLKKGTKVQVNVKSINETTSGEITVLSTSAQSTGGQYLVKISLDKKPMKLLSGMYATVQFPIQKSESDNHIFVPQSAIINHGELYGIYTVSQRNTAILRWLQLGRSFGDKVEVLSGLSPQEKYIISGTGKLYNGVKINIQK